MLPDLLAAPRSTQIPTFCEDSHTSAEGLLSAVNEAPLSIHTSTRPLQLNLSHANNAALLRAAPISPCQWLDPNKDRARSAPANSR